MNRRRTVERLAVIAIMGMMLGTAVLNIAGGSQLSEGLDGLNGSGPNLSGTAGNGDDTPLYKDPNAPIDARVEDLLSRMNLTEKIDQMYGEISDEMQQSGIPIRTADNERLGIPGSLPNVSNLWETEKTEIDGVSILKNRITDIEVAHIHAKNHYDCGYKEAALIGRALSQCVLLLENLAVEQGITQSEMQKEASLHRQTLEKHYPKYLSMLQGASDASGIPVNTIIAVQIYLQPLLAADEGVEFACTTSAAAQPATIENETIVHWTLDGYMYMWHLFDILIPHLIVTEIDGCYSYIAWATPWIAGVGLLNEKGLAYVLNTNTCTDEGEGLHQYEINRMLMESCATVREAADLYENVPRFSSANELLTNLNSNFLLGDALGGLCSIECTHSYFAACYGERGMLGQTNHNQWLDHNKTGGLNPDDTTTSSYWRLKRMWELLRQNEGNITHERYREFVSDHGPEGSAIGNQSTICRHVTENPADKGFGGTCVVWVIYPKSNFIEWYRGHPCRLEPIPLDCSVFFPLNPPSPDLVVSGDTEEVCNCDEGVHNLTVTNIGPYRTIGFIPTLPQGVNITILSSSFVVSNDYTPKASKLVKSWSDVRCNLFTIPGGSSVNMTLLVERNDEFKGGSAEPAFEVCGKDVEPSDFFGEVEGEDAAGETHDTPGFGPVVLPFAVGLVLFTTIIIAISVKRKKGSD